MEGICRGCGQIQEVQAYSQEEADYKATMTCSCGEGESIRRRNQLMKNIDAICGESSAAHGFDPVEQGSIDHIKEAAGLVFENKIDKVTFSIDASLITIKRGTDKVTCSRKMALQLEGTNRV